MSQNGDKVIRPAKYAKSADTLDRILKAALESFSERGLLAVSTREIAMAADVNQPAISYHFGSKDALYLACIDKIIDDYLALASTGEVAHAITLLESESVHAKDARSALDGVMRQVLRFLLGKSTSRSGALLLREMYNPGIAYDRLYRKVWSPGIQLVAGLISLARANGENTKEVTMDALMLISSLSAFTVGRNLSTQTLNWSVIESKELSLIDDRLTALVNSVTRI